jgi:tripartite ATP-independent transporter DctM subunit
VWRRFRTTIWATLYPVLIIGGILGGVFTLTEASVVAVVYALLVGTFVYRELTLKVIYRSMVSASLTASLVMFIAATASGVAWFLNSERVPQMIANFLTGLTESPMMFMVIVNIFLLVVGCVMDLTPALLILGPILYPVSQRYGIDPIYFGVVMVTNLAIGLVTPPVGNCLYIATGVAKLPLTDVIREVWRFLFALIAILFLVTLFPPLITWLPTALRT